jgi:Domain of unknown function (DUF5103)
LTRRYNHNELILHHYFIMMKPHYFFALFLLLSRSLHAQEDTSERIIDENIRSAQINPSVPHAVVQLKGGRIDLSFDYVTDEIKDFMYTIVHCNSDWQPSELQDNEYIDGFNEDRITDISNSINTLVAYNHYRLTLPNQNMRWTRSGNYILKIFDDDDDRRLVLVRRFMVTENLWKVSATVAPIANASKIFSHQEIDFQVVHEGTIVGNPQREVKAFIYQNMRYDRVIGPVSPRPFVALRSSLNFDFQDSIVFPAGKEWRFFDMRIFDYRGNNVKKIERNVNTYQVFLDPQRDRNEIHGYALTGDINGRYSIENRTQGQGFLQCEYANVMFLLARNLPYDDHDVYVVGSMTDWQLKPEFRMFYDEPSKMYYCNPLLKQGYYNYEFQVVNSANQIVDPAEDLEGNWHETENLYSILIYYRPFGERYDRLMVMGGVTSGARN